MDISIIIGLLVALVIICATTVLNNIISNNYKTLKDKWNSRTEVITDITLYIGNLDKFIRDFADNDKLEDVDKQQLFSVMGNINHLLGAVKDYERNNY